MCFKLLSKTKVHSHHWYRCVHTRSHSHNQFRTKKNQFSPPTFHLYHDTSSTPCALLEQVILAASTVGYLVYIRVELISQFTISRVAKRNKWRKKKHEKIPAHRTFFPSNYAICLYSVCLIFGYIFYLPILCMYVRCRPSKIRLSDMNINIKKFKQIEQIRFTFLCFYVICL